MGILVLVIFYGGGLFCIVASLWRMITIARAPMHLRWELYREGSVYQMNDWWTRPQTSLGEKFVSAVLDVVTLREYYHRNRGFWFVLYPFHLGLYSLILWHIWLFATALLVKEGGATVAAMVWGHASAALIVIGGAGVVIMRLSSEKMNVFYPKLHYLKWAFVVITLAGGFYATQYYLGMTGLLDYVREQLSFNWQHKLNPPLFTSIHVVTLAAWLIYIPFGHIMQVFSKYYHDLRWDHIPNTQGSNIERNVVKLLGGKVNWSGPHIQTGSTWVEVAQMLPWDKPAAAVAAQSAPGKEVAPGAK